LPQYVARLPVGHRDIAVIIGESNADRDQQ
jgi:hypothetical protein